MKPVTKSRNSPSTFRVHGDAKPFLIAQLGPYCSYCEQKHTPQSLHVEHIYPESQHPDFKLAWSNFLLACSSCNTYKRLYLNGPQRRLLRRFLWPHHDNTNNAFQYDRNGLMSVSPRVPPNLNTVASDTISMVGLDNTPNVAESYHAQGVAYSIIRKREEAWKIAESFLVAYRKRPDTQQAALVVTAAKETGFFSIWMKVFDAELSVKSALIAEMKAAPECFDATTLISVMRRRI